MPRRISYVGRPSRRKRERIGELIALWRERLLIAHWSVLVEFSRASHTDPSTLVTVDTNERYKEMRVLVYPEFWEVSAQMQERTLAHEMTHAPLNRLANLLDRLDRDRALATGAPRCRAEIWDALEDATEHFANVAWDAYHPEEA